MVDCDVAQDKEKNFYEYSEMVLYKNMVLEESGDVKGAVAHLNEIEKDVFGQCWAMQLVQLVQLVLLALVFLFVFRNI